MAQDAAGLAQLLPQMEPARRPQEWPVIDTGRALIQGQFALLSGRLDEAEPALLRARELHRRWRLPAFMSSPAISLAMLRLAQGRRADAWLEFAPVLQDALTEDSIGPLLLEPREPLNRLLALIPAPERERYRPILTRLAGWQAESPPSGAETTAVHRLSEREREVLQRIAAGDSNKQIARAFDLSPHTVKRHVANILVKLELSTRGQAAAWWRDHGPRSA